MTVRLAGRRSYCCSDRLLIHSNLEREGGQRPLPPHHGYTFEKNSPSLAVALNWGIGSRSFKALVKALHRLQRVCLENSSCTGWK
jgi:hypothetical protein